MLPREQIAKLEEELSNRDPAVRADALAELARLAERGEIILPPAGRNSNLHFHSFFSYNVDGHSPSRIAWESRKAGLLVAGIVDFDVLDGLEEFLKAGEVIGLRTVVSVESRVFVQEYAEKEINSPGEPGVAYHMGVGFFKRPAESSPAAATFADMKALSRRRNEQMLSRVNAYLGEAAVDYERDVLLLTPSGNATERHMLAAYEAKAASIFKTPEELANYWACKLREPLDKIKRLITDSPAFRDLIRARLMKKGGVGYAHPERGDFPPLEKMNEAVSSCGAIPSASWLDGTSPGEQDPKELIAFHVSKGALALNVIPHRNWDLPDPEESRRKRAKLYAIVDAARAAGLIMVYGTERNKQGQPFVDDLSVEALAPIAEVLEEGALAIYGHTAMARWAGKPLGGSWSAETFGKDFRRRNRFYAEVGRLLEPSPRAAELVTSTVAKLSGPEEILQALRKAALQRAPSRVGS